jgi:hypothetical protein
VWVCVASWAQGLFSKDETKEHPNGPNEFLVSQVGGADGNDTRGLDTFGLVAATQQHHRSARGHALKFGNHVAAVLKVVLMNDNGVNQLTPGEQFRILAATPHQQTVAGSRRRPKEMRTVFAFMANEQQRQHGTHARTFRGQSRYWQAVGTLLQKCDSGSQLH